jgi:transglutaminase-like putative cysteine protease
LVLFSSLFSILFLVSCGTNESKSVQATNSTPVYFAEVRFIYDISWDAGVKSLTFRAIVPTSIEGRQKIDGIEYGRAPDIEFSRSGRKYIEYHIDTGSSTSQTISYYVDLSLPDYSRANKYAWRGEEHNNVTLLADSKIESDDPEIVSIAKSLKRRELIDTVQEIHGFVISQITNTEYNGLLSAKEALRQHSGDCTEFSTLAAALLRADDIPCMIPYGIVLETGEPHTWNEIFSPAAGWLIVETTTRRMAYFNPPFHYLYLSDQFYGDDNLNNGAYYSYEYTASDENSEVRIKMHVETSKR